MTADVIQFVPRPNPDRQSVEDKRALELQHRHEVITVAEQDEFRRSYLAAHPDTSPSEMNADSGDCV